MQIVDHFVTEHGRELPIYDRYRYSVKPCWAFYQPLPDLAVLRREGVLTAPEAALVELAVGTRRVGLPLSDAAELLETVAARRSEAFFWPEGSPPFLRPSLAETERRIGRLVLRRDRQLRGSGFRTDRSRPRLLEIGFTSGGHSLAAFERLGFDVTAVDNYYDGSRDESALPTYVLRELANSRAELVVGDISSETTLEGREFDLIFSESVVEHLRDPTGAFRQIRRLLAPGGVTLHYYGPFFTESGGHGPATLDAPFGHVRLSTTDLTAYLTQQRPLEAPVAVPWAAEALNRLPMSSIRTAVTDAGLRVDSWRPDRTHPLELTEAIAAECLEVNPEITRADLLAPQVFFRATST